MDLKILNQEAKIDFLKTNGMEIGSWGEIRHINKKSKEDYIYFKPPKKADDLYYFSHHLASWIPNATNKIFKLDNSTSLLPNESFVLNRLLSKSKINFKKKPSFLFSYNENTQSNVENDLVISQIIFYFLLFEQHAYFTSSNSKNGELIALQDGVIYLIYNTQNAKANFNNLISTYAKNTTELPSWMLSLSS